MKENRISASINKESGLSPQVIYQMNDEREELDVSELFDRVFGRRRFIFAFTLVVMALVMGLLGSLQFIDPPERRFSTIIQFTFPDAENGLYPGGQRFSYNDLVSAKVLEQVYTENALKERGIRFNDFVNAISINPFAESAEFIKKKYQSLLSDSKLTRPEIETLEKAYLEELKVSQSRFVRVSFLEKHLMGIDEVVAQKILMDLPRIWSRNAIEELGVLNLKVVGADFYQPELMARFDYLQALEYLKQSTRTLRESLKILQTDEIGGLARNPRTGATVGDLSVRLDNLVAFEVEPLFSSISSQGVTRDKDKARVFLENTVLNYQDKRSVLIKKSENIADIIAQYTGIETPRPAGGKESGAGVGGFAQYDSSFLDKFTALVEEKSNKVFLQQLLNDRLDVLQQITDIDGQIVKFKRAEMKLEQGDGKLEVTSDEIVADIRLVRTNFENLIGEFKELLEIRNAQALGDSDLLYKLNSDDVLTESGLKARIKRMIIIVVQAGMVGLMLAVIIALFRRPVARTAPDSE